MAHLRSPDLQARPFRAARPRPAHVRAPVAARPVQRRTVQVQASFFNFLAPKSAAAANPKAKELSETLLEIATQTKPGAPVSPVTKAEIEELVSELEPLCMKNPLKSPLLWGTYDVVYCSKPSAVGGPLTKGAGPVVAAGQQARQILEEPGTLINEVSFKTLGLLPGFSRQYGQIRPLSGDTFLLTIKEGEISTGPVKQSKAFDIERKIQIVYLDENLRIARFLPSDELVDTEQEASEGGPEEEEILFVFQRTTDQQEEEEVVEEEEEVEEEEQARPASPVLNLFGGTRKVESLATQAERRVQEQRTRKGTQPFFIGGRGRDAEEEEVDDPRARRQREQEERRAAQDRAKQEAAAARAADQARAAKERERAEREREAERARVQREKEAEERTRAAQQARERAEAEKAARAERQVKIRELLAELGDELKEKQAAARDASKEAKEVARENQAVLRQVAAAEASITEAERDVQQVSAALEEAAAARKNVEQQVRAAQQAVRDAEAAYKQKVGAK